MNSRDAFLHAIAENPDDDDRRLAFADWLEEHGEPGHAEFIRVQCELAPLTSSARFAENGEREADLEHSEGPRLLRDRPVAGIYWYSFGRGFVDTVAVSDIDGFLRHEKELFARAPVRSLRIFSSNGTALAALAASKHFGHLQTLDLSSHQLGDDGLMALVHLPNIGNLKTLGLAGNFLTEEAARALAATSSLRHLSTLDLRGNELGSGGAEAIAHSKHLGGLRTLWLKENAIEDRGAAALAAFPALQRLVSNPIKSAPPAFRAGSVHNGGASSPSCSSTIIRWSQTARAVPKAA